MNVKEQFETLIREFATPGVDYAPPWGLATDHQIRAVCERLDCTLPSSFVSFHTEFAGQLPGINGLRFPVVPEPDAYLGLDATIQDARGWNIPEFYVPFWEDNATFFCFDTRSETEPGEFPVVRCEHDYPEDDDLPFEYASFLEWLCETLRNRRSTNEPA